MIEFVYDELEEIAKKQGKTKKQLKEEIKEKQKKDPENNRKERYKLIGVESGYSIFDTEKKEIFNIRKEKDWKKWQEEHSGEWVTSF